MPQHWFWIMPRGFDIRGRLSPSSADFLETSVEDLRAGQVIEHWNPEAFYRCRHPQEEGEPDDVLYEHLGLEVYSRRLVSALQDAGIVDFQFLPVHVFRSDGSEADSYAIANPFRLVEALDLERSDFDRFGADWPEDRRGKIWGIRRAVLRAQAVERFDCVRLRESLSSLFVSGRVRSVFRKLKVRGRAFSEVELS